MPAKPAAPRWPSDADPVFVAFCEAGLWSGLGKSALTHVPTAGITRPGLITKDALLRIPRVAGSRAERLISAWIAAAPEYELAQLIVPAGISAYAVPGLIDALGDAAATVLEDDPWRIVGVRGIDVAQADAVARSLFGGFDRTDPRRARALVGESLREDNNNGHTITPLDDVRDSLRTWGISDADLACQASVDDGLVVHRQLDGHDALSLRVLADDERSIARDIARLTKSARSWGTAASLKKLSKGLDDAQRRAVELVRTEGVSILTGGPGTGKSRTVGALVELAEKHSQHIVLAAPTGRAAKRLAELTGMEAMTIHRLLGAQGKEGGFRLGRDEPIEADVVVIDEASMVDVRLAAALLAACDDGTHLMVVGDEAQLPSIGPGRVLADLIDSHVVPVTYLETLYRQAAGGQIAKLAAAVRKGELPPVEIDESKEVVIVATSGSGQAAHRTVQLVTDSIPRALGIETSEIQVVTPVHRGAAGTKELNYALKQKLNPGPGAVSGFDVGDRVIATANYLDASPTGYANGEVGVISRLSDKGVTVQFASGSADVTGKALRDLVHGWAITVHRAQGSEWQAVVVVAPPEAGRLMSRSLIYTAFTRAQKHLSIVRTPGPALAYAVRERALRPRRTTLAERLREVMPTRP